METVYLAPVTTDPNTHSLLLTSDGVQLLKSMAQAALVVLAQGEAVTSERLHPQGARLCCSMQMQNWAPLCQGSWQISEHDWMNSSYG